MHGTHVRHASSASGHCESGVCLCFPRSVVGPNLVRLPDDNCTLQRVTGPHGGVGSWGVPGLFQEWRLWENMHADMLTTALQPTILNSVLTLDRKEQIFQKYALEKRKER